MTWAGLGEVYWKEVRSFLRDRQVVIATLLVPAILYPGLIVGVFELLGLVKATSERRIVRVAIEGEDGGLADFLREHGGRIADGGGGVALVSPAPRGEAHAEPSSKGAPLSMAPADLLRASSGEDSQADAVIVAKRAGPGPHPDFPDIALSIYWSSSLHSSAEAHDRLSTLLETWRRERVEALAEVVGIENAKHVLDPIDARWESVATGAEQAGYVAGLLLPLLLTIVVAIGVFYPALECTVGEKERGTLETTLLSPLSRSTLVVGKYLAVVSAGVASFALNFAGMSLSFVHLASQLRVGDLKISFATCALALGGAIVLAALLGAIMMPIAFFARSYKEGQSWLSPIYFATLIPAVVLANPDATLTPLSALAPLLNCALLFRESLSGDVSAFDAILVLASSAFYAALALGVATRLLDREDVATGGEVSIRSALRHALLRREIREADS